MSGGHRRILTGALAALTLVTTTGASPVRAGNAGFHLTKTVSGATITPVLSLTLAVDRSTAIPGDTLKYSGSVSNSGDSWAVSGQFTAESHLDSDATVASYWDEVQYCLTGCGEGLNDHWTALAGTAAAQSGYSPATPPGIATGLTLKATPAPEANVTYPTGTDTILGTAIAAGATAIWTYTATIALTPAQVALLGDPGKVAALRNVAHFEALPRNANAAQPWTDSASLMNGFQQAANAGNASNAVVSLVLPNRSTSELDSTSIAGLASIAPGAQVAWSAAFKVPPAPAKAGGESDAAYLGRLAALDGSVLSATASVSATGSSGPVTATAPAPATTTEQLPILGITKTGPAKVDAGTTENNPLAVNNSGHATAAAITVTDSVPGGATGTISGLPAGLAPGKSANGNAAFPVPAGQPAGSLTDTAGLTWQDANANPYGPVSSSWSTTVISSTLLGARLTLSPATAGPDVVGTAQAFTANLVDSSARPIANQSVTLTVTGANPGSQTQTTDSGGSASFSYSGAIKGTDQVQASTSSGSITLQSNTVSVAWIQPIARVSTTLVTARIYYGGCGSFCANVANPPVFTQSLPTIDLNPPAGTIPHNPTGIGVETRPMYDVTTDVGGTFTGAIALQGTDANGVLHQAGVNDLGGFDAVFTANYTVAAAGDVTFNFFSDDGFIFGISGGASRVSGSFGNPPPQTPLMRYPIMGAYNFPTAPVANNITVHFPAAGSYPYEVDYSECCGGQIALTMATNGTGLPPTGNLSLTPFAPPANTVGKTQTAAVAAMDANGIPLSGIAITLDVSGANPQQIASTTGANGVASFSYQAANAGVDQLQGSALVSGVPEISNIVNLTWNPAPPAPTISGLSLPDGSLLTKATPVSATITPPAGQTITGTSLTYQGAHSGSPTTIPSSATPGAAGAVVVAGTFDPTLLPNDAYTVTVNASASGGGAQTAVATVTVSGNLKPGREVRTYQDLSLPVSGYQMQVQRVYDSFDKASGDFGVGWHVQVANLRMAPNRTLGAAGWTQYNSFCALGLCLTAFRNSGPRDVTVTWPDGRTEVFDFTPSGGTNVFFGGAPAYTARPGTGTTSTLSDPFCGSLGYTGDGNLYGCDGQPYNPQRLQLTTADGRVVLLDRNAGLVSMTDRNGNKLSVSAAGVQSSAGPGIGFSRDSAGRITRISGPSGQVLTFAYSLAGDLVASVDPDGNQTTYAYDGNHDLVSVTGSGAVPVLTMTYDSSGRLSSITDADGNKTNLAVDSAAQTQTLIDPLGKLTTVASYDDAGDLIGVVKSAGGTQVTQTMTYDSSGNLLTVKDATGATTSATFDANGDMTSLTDAVGHTTRYSYDAYGNPTAVIAPGGATAASFVYDSSGNLVSIADGTGATSSYGYDGAGHVIRKTDPTGNVTTYTYTTSGNLASATDAAGTTKYATDASGRLTAVTDADGRTTAMVYDANGNLLSQTDAGGRTRSWTYDPLGHLASITDASGGRETLTYDAAGRLTAATDAKGVTVSRSYDADGRLLGVTAPDGSSATFAYDGFGHMLSAVTPAANLAFTYDARSRLLSQASGGAQPAAQLHYSYDAAGRLVSSSGPDGSVSYAYDALSNLTSLTDPGGGSFTFTYDAASRLLHLTRPNGVTDSNSYDGAGRLLSRTSAAGASTLAEESYTYASSGTRSSRADLGNTATYSRDPAAQLLSVANSLGSLPAEAYTYDASGNRASAAGVAQTYDTGGRLVRFGGTVYSYDADGERTSATDAAGHVTTYIWNDFHQLTSVSLPNGTSIQYKYDALGRRVEVDQGSSQTNFVYDGLQLRLQYQGGSLFASFESLPDATSPLEMRQGGATYYYLADALGSTVGLADQSGALVATQRYDSFGNPLAATGSVANPLTYIGQQFDAATGLYYLNARYYDASSGNFLSADPEPQLNAYSYAQNDPVDLSDVSGRDAFEEEASLLAKDIRALDGFGKPVTKWTIQGPLKETVGQIIRTPPDPLDAGGDTALALAIILKFILANIGTSPLLTAVSIGLAVIFAIIVFAIVCAAFKDVVPIPQKTKGPVIRAPNPPGICSGLPPELGG